MAWREEYSVIVKALIASQLGLMPGNKFFMDPVNGSDGNSGSIGSPVKSLAAGYGLLRNNQNDVLVIVGGASLIPLTATFTWSKNYAHCIGIGVELRRGGRVRITDILNAYTPRFTISGNGCIFKNIHWQGALTGNAGNLVNVAVTGLRNQFVNCEFEGPLNTTEGAGTVAHRQVTIGISAQDNSFERCTFGQWTNLDGSSAGASIGLLGDNAGTYFYDCMFYNANGSNSFVFIDAGVNLGGEYSFVTFEKCKFFELKIAASITVAVKVPTNGHVFLIDCKSDRIAAWTTSADTRVHLINGAADASAGGIGIANT